MSAVKRLRVIGIVEAISFLLLLGVAMPMKYLMALPLAVKIVGWLHGVLFILFALALLAVKNERDWGVKDALPYFIAALLPFGPFVMDRKLKALE